MFVWFWLRRCGLSYGMTVTMLNEDEGTVIVTVE